MTAGIAAGFASVLLLCGSYVFSRSYIRKHRDSVKLSVYSQLLMALGGVALLAGTLPFVDYPLCGRFWGFIGGIVCTFLLGQTSFLIMLKKVEATRAASLLGLKLMALAAITVLTGNDLSGVQWMAVFLCTVAAVGMNFSGVRIPLTCFGWLMLAVFCYASCDICITKLMLMMPSKSMFINALCVIGSSYTALGIAVIPGLLKYPPRRENFTDAVPFSLFYFCSMIFLFASFGLIGVVFGSIIQAGRGIVSVLLGVVLLHLGIEKNEPQVSAGVWIRRAVMALLMLSAIVMYSVSVGR